MSLEQDRVVNAAREWFNAKLRVHMEGVHALSGVHHAESELLEACKDMILRETEGKA